MRIRVKDVMEQRLKTEGAINQAMLGASRSEKRQENGLPPGDSRWNTASLTP